MRFFLIFLVSFGCSKGHFPGRNGPFIKEFNCLFFRQSQALKDGLGFFLVSSSMRFISFAVVMAVLGFLVDAVQGSHMPDGIHHGLHEDDAQDGPRPFTQERPAWMGTSYSSMPHRRRAWAMPGSREIWDGRA